MCTHKPYTLLPPLAVAVQGGASLHPPVDGTRPDVGEGGSISEKNPAYCELTVQYYAWKNERADYYGFCHYRRFFGFGAKNKRPYLALGTLSEKQARDLLGTPEAIRKAIEEGNLDAVTVRPEDMGISVARHYATSAHQYAEDLDRFAAILRKKYPHLSPHADAYLSQSRQYFCNMFILRRELFFDYCEHLFSLLEEFDRDKPMRGDFQSDRTDGYLAERFFGIYLSYLRDRNARILEVPRIDADCPIGKRVLYHLLPPESKRRMLLKRLIKKQEAPPNKKNEKEG